MYSIAFQHDGKQPSLMPKEKAQRPSRHVWHKSREMCSRHVATAEFEFSSFPHKDFTIDIFLRQQWTDKRLDHGLNHTITLSSRWAMKKIWVPDSYFVNAKTGRMHRVTTPNMMLTLGPGGVIKYNARYFSQICLLLAFY